MNLAIKDVRHNLLTFLLASVGIGLLLLASMTITGLYQGLVGDALRLICQCAFNLPRFGWRPCAV
jgi:putative ABC transport system permease protein